MAKKKRRPVRSKARLPLSKRMVDQLEKAEGLLRRKQWPAAAELLEDLGRRYPRREEVLTLRLELAAEMHDFPTHSAVCRQLIELRPTDAELRVLLGGSYLAAGRIALGLQTFQDFLEHWPNHPEAAEVRQTVAKIEPDFRQLLAGIGLEGPDAFRLAAWHEQIQVHLEEGAFAEVRRVAERLLAVRPTFAPALNNLSEAYARDGDYSRAVETTRRVLAFEPDNVHALGNLTRYLYLDGRAVEAEETASRLRTLTPIHSDDWAKIAEALSSLGDDAGVEETARRARDSDLAPAGPRAALVEHLAAVAAYRQGREADARLHWKTALRHQPGFPLAQDNLDDLRQPAEQRHAAWPFDIAHWLPRKLHDQLRKRLTNVSASKRDTVLQKEVRDFLRSRPNLERLIPILLDRGDPAGRTWALLMARLADTPAMQAALRDFALSQRGPDEQRLEASREAQEAGVFPSGMVRMWMRGEWTEILLLSFEVTEETERKHSLEVENLASEGHDALRAGEGVRAESLLKRALEKEPGAPDLLNNLAAAYMLQDRVREAEDLIRQIHARFPDYWFGTIGVARLAIRAGRTDEAAAMLRPLLQQRKMHASEFAALAMAEIELQLASRQREGARSWVKMWEDILPDHPELPAWRSRVNQPTLWQRLLGR
jgi:tetratricopeptide (TPR) repeat protein